MQLKRTVFDPQSTQILSLHGLCKNINSLYSVSCQDKLKYPHTVPERKNYVMKHMLIIQACSFTYLKKTTMPLLREHP